MSDHKFLLFGSFTEDETRVVQSQYVQKNSDPIVSTGLQFGSLDFHSLSLLKGFKDEGKQCDASRRSSNEKTSELQMNGVFTNEKPTFDKLAEVQEFHVNGNINGCFPDSVVEANKKKLDISSKHASETGTANDNDVELLKSQKVHRDDLEGSDDRKVFVELSPDVKRGDAVSKITREHAVSVKRLLPRGLINPGNLCFLNATLQSLLFCSPFTQLLQDLRNRNIPKVECPTLHAFAEFISEFDTPDDLSSTKSEKPLMMSGKSFMPIMFDLVLKQFTPDLPTGVSGRPRQEDAQEFLSFVMDQMHSELLKTEGQISSPNGWITSLTSSAEDDGWETVGPKNKSAVTRTQSFVPSELSAIFGGQLRSVVKARGNKASATVQPFLLLHLDILPEVVNTIEDALHLFSALETLEGYRTSAGKAGLVNASKSVKIQTLPKILILHLMRFSYGTKGSSKLHKPVRFPLDLVLNRELLVSSTAEGRSYKLVATITHHGKDHSKGHYTADARYTDGQWLRFDDASVSVLKISQVLHDQAYLLFYKQT